MARREGTQRISVDLPDEQMRALREAMTADGVGVGTRIRAMVTVWEQDSTVRVQVDSDALALHEAGARRRAAGAAVARKSRWGSTAG